jgi:uncharacterized protein (TIGR03000 family)
LPPDAELWFEDDKTRQAGASRDFVSPPLQVGRVFTYKVRARWTDSNGRVIDRARPVNVEAGRRVVVDFATEAAVTRETRAWP